MQCAIAFGKFLTVQEGVSFSGGSWEDEYDSVRCGMMTWVLPFVPSVPDSSKGFSKKTQRWSMYRPEAVLVLFGSEYHTR